MLLEKRDMEKKLAFFPDIKNLKKARDVKQGETDIIF